MIEGKIFLGEEGHRLTGLLRYKVLCEELDINPEIEHDFIDYFSYHIAILEGEEIVGAGRLSFIDNKFMVDRVVVRADRRKEGIGDMLVRMLAFKALELGGKEVYTYAEEKYLNFYSKIGFNSISSGHNYLGINMNLLRLDTALKKGCSCL